MRARARLSGVIACLLFLTGILISDIPKMIASQGWPTTQETIISNRIVGQKFKQYNGTFYTNYEVYIRYQYSVNGAVYYSSSVNSLDTLFNPHSFASRYPLGKDVAVYYNPKNPWDAVLEPGFVSISGAFDVFSYLLFGAGIYFAFLGISKLREKGTQRATLTVLIQTVRALFVVVRYS
jgi:hypothetical protein